MAATATSLQPPWRSHPVVSASSASSSFDDSSATTTAVSSPVRATTSSTNINEAQQQPRSSTESSFGEEFFAEPEWQRAPGRWKKSEEKLLREMKVLLADDLQRAKSQGVAFPEVVGSRRMLRFLRGHKYDVQHAAKMMSAMLKWREANGVNAIREKIVNNKLFDPSQFPEGDMITELFPVLVANPLCVDLDGAPISYETYGFSPRQVTAHANGDLGFFIHFHIYCQEFKQICLDSLSDAKEMENLARIADRQLSSSSSSDGRNQHKASGPRNHPASETKLQQQQQQQQQHQQQHGPDGSYPDNNNSNNNNNNNNKASKTPTTPTSDMAEETGERQRAVSRSRFSPGGRSSGRSAGAQAGAGHGQEGFAEGRQDEGERGLEEEENEEEDEEEPWGVLLRNTIIRDLKGFGMEHAGPIGRTLISKVMAVSQDNYPEMMGACYIINAPWVFYALWKGLAPLMSPTTVKKVKVLNYDFLPTLRKKISVERLPVRVGGRCDPSCVTSEEMEDFVVCGRVAKLRTSGDGEAAENTGGGVMDDDGGGGGNGGGENDDDDEDDDDDDDDDEGFGSAGNDLDAAVQQRQRQQRLGRRRTAAGGERMVSPARGRTAGGDAMAGRKSLGSLPAKSSNSSTAAGAAIISSGRGSGRGNANSVGTTSTRSSPTVSFRNLFERMGARDGGKTPSSPTGLAATYSPRSTPTFGDAAGAASAGKARLSASGPLLQQQPHQQRRQREASAERMGSSEHARPLSPSGPGVTRWRVVSDNTARASGVTGGGIGGGARVPEKTVTEDFDSRVVDRALELSMRRKARRLTFPPDVVTNMEDDGISRSFSCDRSAGDLSPSTSTSPVERSVSAFLSSEPTARARAGWVKERWHSIKRRRETKKLVEKDRQRQAISAGDCAAWVPNSERDSCLHCERPFTILLRRHHCRMCGELVCAQCSPHRVRLSLGDNDSGETSSRPGSPRRPKKKRGGPTTVAVRVCTDCHISLQTVTVATALGDEDGSIDREAGGPTHGGNAPRSPGTNGDRGSSRGEAYEVSVSGAGRPRRAGVVGGVVELLQNVFLGEDFAGYFGGPRFHGRVGVHAGGRGSVEDLEVLEGATMSEIPGDVVLADVVEWGKIERRAAKVWQVVLACLFTVIEMHHIVLLEALLRVWRCSGQEYRPAAAEALRMVLTNVHHPDTPSAGSSSVIGSPREDRAQRNQRRYGDADRPRSGVGGIGVSSGGGVFGDPATGGRTGSSPTPLSESDDDSVRRRSRGERHERRRGQQPNGHDATPQRHDVSAAKLASPTTPLCSRNASSHPTTYAYTPRRRVPADESLPTSTAVSAHTPDEFTAVQSEAGGFGGGRRAAKYGGNDGPSAEDMLWAALDVVMFYAPWSVAALLGFQLWLIGLGREGGG